MNPKLIKTEKDYQAALARLDEIFDAEPGTADGDEAELLTALIEMYEEKKYPIDLPDPVSAIKFRMEQEGLKAKDLVPYIGSASRVSEVLSGVRTLSLTMIRNLVNGLDIPAEVLLKEPGAALPSDAVLKLGRHFPVAEMVKRGWFAGFQGTAKEAKSQLEDLMIGFVGALGTDAMVPALNRQHVRSDSKVDKNALTAWRIRVATQALRESLPAFLPRTLTSDFLREVARLSYLDSGPMLAKEFLNKNGIHVIFEPHLPKTYLDGAALKLPNGSPIVAMTLRQDRLDNFWFTLFHELAHVKLHLCEDGIEVFFDNLKEGAKDQYEKEADKLAAESLIPQSAWRAARLKSISSPLEIVSFAEKLRISPAIPAGRIRFESEDYSIFKELVGSRKVRNLFAESAK
jgi:HTH-type transcriptional regulator/antitoxin HigA